MRPVLSILVPFYRDDPCALVASLAAQARQEQTGSGQSAVELILYHDDGEGDGDGVSGGGDAALADRTAAALTGFPGAARLIRGGRNRGRAFARNALANAAQAASLLFLDADMAPADDGFLRRWLAAARGGADIVFGGFSVPRDVTPDYALHRAFSAAGDCLEAAARRRRPTQYVFTSNLLVRAEVLRRAPFDIGFSGWGWEDAEWAARAGEDFAIGHIDNPAVHLGLESEATLLRRFRESADNYARFVGRHPELAAGLPSHKWAQRLKRAPGAHALRPALAGLVRLRPAPMRLRVLALKLWRASWYAEALP